MPRIEKEANPDPIFRPHDGDVHPGSGLGVAVMASCRRVPFLHRRDPQGPWGRTARRRTPSSPRRIDLAPPEADQRGGIQPPRCGGPTALSAKTEGEENARHVEGAHRGVP